MSYRKDQIRRKLYFVAWAEERKGNYLKAFAHYTKWALTFTGKTDRITALAVLKRVAKKIAPDLPISYTSKKDSMSTLINLYNLLETQNAAYLDAKERGDNLAAEVALSSIENLQEMIRRAKEDEKKKAITE